MEVFLPFEPIPDRYHDAWWLIGNYDGVHKGHQALIAAARQKSAKIGLMTFEPHPRSYFDPGSPPFRLTPWPDRQEILRHYGIDALVIHGFDAGLANLSAEDFIDKLIMNQVQAAGVVVGAGFRFGCQRQGTVEMLLDRLGPQRVVVVPPLADEQGMVYSSSRVRGALGAGEAELAQKLLGRPWSLSGIAEYGLRRGHTLGFPTANISFGAYLQPRHGVYAALVSGAGLVQHPALAHCGSRPTLEDGAVRLGVHLLDYDGFLYDQTLRVELLHFFRPEAAYAGIPALKEGIAHDVSAARAWFANGWPDRTGEG